MPFSRLLMSPIGTKRRFSNVRFSFAIGAIADIVREDRPRVFMRHGLAAMPENSAGPFSRGVAARESKHISFLYLLCKHIGALHRRDTGSGTWLLSPRFYGMASREQQQCWIGAGLTNLLEGRVLELTDTIARVELISPAVVPEECNLFFTPDCKVGRKCAVIRQVGSEVLLSIQGRIGPPPAPDDQGTPPKRDPSRFVEI
jgi:hypothetical protein